MGPKSKVKQTRLIACHAGALSASEYEKLAFLPLSRLTESYFDASLSENIIWEAG